MFVSMIGAFAQPVVLAMSLYSSAESLTTVMSSHTAPIAPVASVEPVAASNEELAEITAPGIQLSKYLTPAGKASMCAALTKALGTNSATPAINQTLRDCYPEASSSKALENSPISKPL
ncbi:Conserved hypothetical secreted protein [Pseudomonas veronii 1YdBTEX2]|uniref:Uncharacterized protein n=2 Tax=Pseudomonas veronii TaxID=76761 RepID=A0A7Y1FAZ5_PSEVE|nr:hypothetical protein [Pseudomonas veronii]NMY11239.1 hypothetical protein [Pseudomonas veronii]SBW84965.1 Conserved hypothetical secreted protein [Pseudomonas veronii 1YdBTEX2]